MAKAKRKAKINDSIPKAKKVFLDSAPAHQLKSNFLTMDGFDNFISKLGINNDNALSAGTYEFNLVTRNRLLLEAAYRGSWVVGKVIDCVAEDMTREGIEITTSDSQDDLELLENDMSKLGIWRSLCFTEQWGRLYGACIGIVQIEGQDLSTPLDVETIAKDQFQGIAVYDRWQLNPILYDVIDSGPDIGLPKYYDIVNNPTQTDPTSATATGQLRVHHSRVFRNIGIELPYFQAITEMMWGESILERLWDRLISFDNATMSAASLIDRANLRTVGIDGLREIIAAGGQAQQGLVAMFEMMRSMQVNEGLTLLDKNDTFASTAYSFSGLSDMLLQFSQQISGACDTPMVRLFSQSPAGLNSTGDADLRMYYDSIKAKQEAKFRRPMDLILKIMWRSTFGHEAPADLKFKFKPLWQMSATDKATYAKTTVETINEAVEAGLAPREVGMKELQQAAADIGLFSNITDEHIAEAESEEPPMPESTGMETNPPLAQTGENEEPRFPKEMPKGQETGDSILKRIYKSIMGD
jgi:phage-related protein (TIGR01555 family)